MSVSIRMDASAAIKTLREVADKISTVEGVIETHSAPAMEDMAELAKYYCPVDTGRLRESIRMEGAFPHYTLIADAINQYGQPYAAYVEYGTSKMPAQPFMWPAVYTIWEDLRPTLGGAIRRHLLG